MNDKEKEPAQYVAGPQARLFARHPRSALHTLSVAALLGAALTSGILALAFGFPANTALLIVTASLLIGAGLAATRFRWMPLLIALLSALFLYELLKAPYVTYHLTNPKGGEFFPFVMDLLLIAFTLVTLGASIGTAVQNYRQPLRFQPLAMTGLLAGVAGLLLGAVLIAAIAQPGAPASTTYTNGVPTVHMSAGGFTQPSVTIAKGAKLLLVDDVPVTHILANGSWQNGVPRPVDEPGAPKVNNVMVTGTSVEIGPFPMAGTYHIYCTLHPGMTLTIIVQ